MKRFVGRRPSARKKTPAPRQDCEICILAGGLSRRMGRDKARLKLGRRTMLAQIASTAKRTGLPVRVIRRDRVPRCGPLGGIYTALASTMAGSVLFLSCDMPLITTDLLHFLLRTQARAWFVSTRGYGKGFPFLLPKSCLPVVEARLRAARFSLQGLAKELRAGMVRPPAGMERELFNVNTPEDWKKARQRVWNSKLRPCAGFEEIANRK